MGVVRSVELEADISIIDASNSDSCVGIAVGLRSTVRLSCVQAALLLRSSVSNLELLDPRNLRSAADARDKNPLQASEMSHAVLYLGLNMSSLWRSLASSCDHGDSRSSVAPVGRMLTQETVKIMNIETFWQSSFSVTCFQA